MIGASVGSYRIVRQIGEGGMGAVYLGEHAMLGRAAAIKILLPQLSHNREIVGRFFNEARATTAIRHPGIVEIYDFGFLPDGAAYIAMEMLDGESVASRLRRAGRLPFDKAIDIGRQTSHALTAAHGRGITHRDLKPDNMFLIRDPEIGERVKLLDFGIAKLAAEEGGNRTRTGVVMGTPVYMSPEQCRGVADLDHRADLYSLGCVMYELVSGRPPFVSDSAGDIIAHHLYFEPEPVRRHEASVPEPLERLIMGLLAKEPAKRPGSAAEVASILEGWRGMPAAASSHAMQVITVPPVGIVPTTPTTLSGSAGALTGPPATTTNIGAKPKRGKLVAIAGAVVAVGAAAAALAMRQPSGSSSSAPVAAATMPAPATATPSTSAPANAPAPAASATPPAPAPTAPAPTAPTHVDPPATPAVAVAPSKPADEIAARPSKPADEIAARPSKPADEIVARPSKPADEIARPSKPADEPKPSKPDAAKPGKAAELAAKPSKPADEVAKAKPADKHAEPTKKLDTAAKKPAETAAKKPADEAKPAAIAAPAPAPTGETKPAATAAKADDKPADAAKPASKWGRLMGDKSGDANSVYEGLLRLAKLAATSGDCAAARGYAARIAESNAAMYRARVVTDSDIAACLRSK